MQTDQVRNQAAQSGRKEAYPLALSAKALAAALGVSVRHIRRLDAAGKLPRAAKLGRCCRWSVSEVQEWLAAGCPERWRWEELKSQR